MKYPHDGSFEEIFSYSMRAKRVEPVARMKGGPFPQHHAHRFEIKGGISMSELMARNISTQNALLRRLKEKNPQALDT